MLEDTRHNLEDGDLVTFSGRAAPPAEAEDILSSHEVSKLASFEMCAQC
jgi:hypothetical protein